MKSTKESFPSQKSYQERYGFSTKNVPVAISKKGLSEEIVRYISQIKNEPQWMLEFRLSSLDLFYKKSLPEFGVPLREIDFNDLYYYVKPSDTRKKSWEEVPQNIKDTFEKLGIPEAERKFLAGVEAQFDSEAVYGSLLTELTDQGIIFTDTDTALKKYPELFEEYFSKLVPNDDNKFSALNSAVWSGGSFIYIPKGVQVKRPLQAYFRINAQKMGQFERTLIIVDEGAFAHYVEGCTAPTYTDDLLHAAVVEVYVKKGARFRYTTIQNWSTNVYNLVTKRALVEEDGIMEWVDGNLGSKSNMKYPSCVLKGDHSRGEVLSLAMAGENQIQDTGAKMIHLGKNTSSVIVSKSISMDGGDNTYRGLVHIAPSADFSKSHTECDALILDEKSSSRTIPVMRNHNANSYIEHEATVSKISAEKLFYLQSRGLSVAEAQSLVVSGFIEPIVKELPLEYAVELNRLIELQMEGSVG